MSTSPTNFHIVTSASQFKSLLSEDLNRVSLINFWAPWANPCIQMNEIVLESAKKYPRVLVLQVEAEEQSDIAESFNVEAVPVCLVLRGHTLLARVDGADASALTKALTAHFGPTAPSTTPSAAPPTKHEETPAELETRLRGLMTQSKCVLFMKGSPDAPRCGFSRKIVALLREHQVEFTTFDILEDESVRAGLKTLNDWPTFPQFIVNGEFVGGLDIVTDMVSNGELKELLNQ